MAQTDEYIGEACEELKKLYEIAAVYSGTGDGRLEHTGS